MMEVGTSHLFRDHRSFCTGHVRTVFVVIGLRVESRYGVAEREQTNNETLGFGRTHRRYGAAVFRTCVHTQTQQSASTVHGYMCVSHCHTFLHPQKLNSNDTNATQPAGVARTIELSPKKTNMKEVINLSTYSRSDLSNIPVFVPAQRYNVYSRPWSSTMPPVDDANVNDPLLMTTTTTTTTTTTNQMKRRNTWSCMILSILFTVLFYAVFFGIAAIIAYMVVRLFQKEKDEFEMNVMNVMNRTQDIATGTGN